MKLKFNKGLTGNQRDNYRLALELLASGVKAGDLLVVKRQYVHTPPEVVRDAVRSFVGVKECLTHIEGNNGS